MQRNAHMRGVDDFEEVPWTGIIGSNDEEEISSIADENLFD